MSNSRDKLGHLLDGRIKLTGILGSGAYGVVYSGIDVSTGDKLAIKALPKRLAANLHGNNAPLEIGPNSLMNPGPSSSPCTPPPPSQNLKRFRSDDEEDHHIINVRSVPIGDIVDRYERAMKQHKSFTVSASKLNPGELACREIALHAKVHDHPFILSIHEVLESTDSLYMVLQHFETGDLFHAITTTTKFVHQDANIRAIFIQLLDAVAYCHSRGVYHCDLKPENILISEDGRSIRLADFGLATSQSFCTDFGYGSSFYMSPERLIKVDVGGSVTRHPATVESSKVFSASSSDVWALGVILLNLCCGRNPWKKASLLDDPSFRAFTKDPGFLEKIMPITPQLNEILRKVFDLNFTRRPTVTEFRNFILNCPMVRPRLSKSVSCPGLSIHSNAQSVLLPGFQSSQASPLSFMQARRVPPATGALPQTPWLCEGTSNPPVPSHNPFPVMSPVGFPQRPIAHAIFFSPTSAASFHPSLQSSQLLPPLPLHSAAGLCHACEEGDRPGHGLLSPPASEIATSAPVTPEQQILKTPADGKNSPQRVSKRPRTARVPMTPL
jgi:serine/threonine protein kinase